MIKLRKSKKKLINKNLNSFNFKKLIYKSLKLQKNKGLTIKPKRLDLRFGVNNFYNKKCPTFFNYLLFKLMRKPLKKRIKAVITKIPENSDEVLKTFNHKSANITYNELMYDVRKSREYISFGYAYYTFETIRESLEEFENLYCFRNKNLLNKLTKYFQKVNLTNSWNYYNISSIFKFKTNKNKIFKKLAFWKKKFLNIFLEKDKKIKKGLKLSRFTKLDAKKKYFYYRFKKRANFNRLRRIFFIKFFNIEKNGLRVFEELIKLKKKKTKFNNFCFERVLLKREFDNRTKFKRNHVLHKKNIFLNIKDYLKKKKELIKKTFIRTYKYTCEDFNKFLENYSVILKNLEVVHQKFIFHQFLVKREEQTVFENYSLDHLLLKNKIKKSIVSRLMAKIEKNSFFENSNFEQQYLDLLFIFENNYKAKMQKKDILIFFKLKENIEIYFKKLYDLKLLFFNKLFTKKFNLRNELNLYLSLRKKYFRQIKDNFERLKRFFKFIKKVVSKTTLHFPINFFYQNILKKKKKSNRINKKVKYFLNICEPNHKKEKKRLLKILTFIKKDNRWLNKTMNRLGVSIDGTKKKNFLDNVELFFKNFNIFKYDQQVKQEYLNMGYFNKKRFLRKNIPFVFKLNFIKNLNKKNYYFIKNQNNNIINRLNNNKKFSHKIFRTKLEDFLYKGTYLFHFFRFCQFLRMKVIQRYKLIHNNNDNDNDNSNGNGNGNDNGNDNDNDNDNLSLALSFKVNDNDSRLNLNTSIIQKSNFGEKDLKVKSKLLTKLNQAHLNNYLNLFLNTSYFLITNFSAKKNKSKKYEFPFYKAKSFFLKKKKKKNLSLLRGLKLLKLKKQENICFDYTFFNETKKLLTYYKSKSCKKIKLNFLKKFYYSFNDFQNQNNFQKNNFENYFFIENFIKAYSLKSKIRLLKLMQKDIKNKQFWTNKLVVNFKKNSAFSTFKNEFFFFRLNKLFLKNLDFMRFKLKTNFQIVFSDFSFKNKLISLKSSKENLLLGVYFIELEKILSISLNTFNKYLKERLFLKRFIFDFLMQIKLKNKLQHHVNLETAFSFKAKTQVNSFKIIYSSILIINIFIFCNFEFMFKTFFFSKIDNFDYFNKFLKKENLFFFKVFKLLNRFSPKNLVLILKQKILKHRLFIKKNDLVSHNLFFSRFRKHKRLKYSNFFRKLLSLKLLTKDKMLNFERLIFLNHINLKNQKLMAYLYKKVSKLKNKLLKNQKSLQYFKQKFMSIYFLLLLEFFLNSDKFCSLDKKINNCPVISYLDIPQYFSCLKLKKELIQNMKFYFVLTKSEIERISFFNISKNTIDLCKNQQDYTRIFEYSGFGFKNSLIDSKLTVVLKRINEIKKQNLFLNLKKFLFKFKNEANFLELIKKNFYTKKFKRLMIKKKKKKNLTIVKLEKKNNLYFCKLFYTLFKRKNMFLFKKLLNHLSEFVPKRFLFFFKVLKTKYYKILVKNKKFNLKKKRHNLLLLKTIIKKQKIKIKYIKKKVKNVFLKKKKKVNLYFKRQFLNIMKSKRTYAIYFKQSIKVNNNFLKNKKKKIYKSLKKMNLVLKLLKSHKIFYMISSTRLKILKKNKLFLKHFNILKKKHKKTPLKSFINRKKKTKKLYRFSKTKSKLKYKFFKKKKFKNLNFINTFTNHFNKILNKDFNLTFKNKERSKFFSFKFLNVWRNFYFKKYVKLKRRLRTNYKKIDFLTTAKEFHVLDTILTFNFKNRPQTEKLIFLKKDKLFFARKRKNNPIYDNKSVSYRRNAVDGALPFLHFDDYYVVNYINKTKRVSVVGYRNRRQKYFKQLLKKICKISLKKFILQKNKKRRKYFYSLFNSFRKKRWWPKKKRWFKNNRKKFSILFFKKRKMMKKKKKRQKFVAKRNRRALFFLFKEVSNNFVQFFVLKLLWTFLNVIKVYDLLSPTAASLSKYHQVKKLHHYRASLRLRKNYFSRYKGPSIQSNIIQNIDLNFELSKFFLGILKKKKLNVFQTKLFNNIKDFSQLKGNIRQLVNFFFKQKRKIFQFFFFLQNNICDMKFFFGKKNTQLLKQFFFNKKKLLNFFLLKIQKFGITTLRAQNALYLDDYSRFNNQKGYRLILNAYMKLQYLYEKEKSFKRSRERLKKQIRRANIFEKTSMYLELLNSFKDFYTLKKNKQIITKNRVKVNNSELFFLKRFKTSKKEFQEKFGETKKKNCTFFYTPDFNTFNYVLDLIKFKKDQYQRHFLKIKNMGKYDYARFHKLVKFSDFKKYNMYVKHKPIFKLKKRRRPRKRFIRKLTPLALYTQRVHALRKVQKYKRFRKFIDIDQFLGKINLPYFKWINYQWFQLNRLNNTNKKLTFTEFTLLDKFNYINQNKKLNEMNKANKIMPKRRRFRKSENARYFARIDKLANLRKTLDPRTPLLHLTKLTVLTASHKLNPLNNYSKLKKLNKRRNRSKSDDIVCQKMFLTDCEEEDKRNYYYTKITKTKRYYRKYFSPRARENIKKQSLYKMADFESNAFDANIRIKQLLSYKEKNFENNAQVLEKEKVIKDEKTIDTLLNINSFLLKPRLVKYKKKNIFFNKFINVYKFIKKNKFFLIYNENKIKKF